MEAIKARLEKMGLSTGESKSEESTEPAASKTESGSDAELTIKIVETPEVATEWTVTASEEARVKDEKAIEADTLDEQTKSVEKETERTEKIELADVRSKAVEPLKVGDQYRQKEVSEVGVKGVVKWFNVMKGYGFIHRLDVDKDIFVHRSAILYASRKTWPPSLGNKEEVEFVILKGKEREEAALVTGPDGADVEGSEYSIPYKFRFLIYRKDGPYVGPPPPSPSMYAKGYKWSRGPLPKNANIFDLYSSNSNRRRRSVDDGRNNDRRERRDDRRRRSSGGVAAGNGGSGGRGDNNRRRKNSRQQDDNRKGGGGKSGRRGSAGGSGGPVTPAQRDLQHRRLSTANTDDEMDGDRNRRKSGGNDRRRRGSGQSSDYSRSNNNNGQQQRKRNNRRGQNKKKDVKESQENDAPEQEGNNTSGISTEKDVKGGVTGSGDGPKSKAELEPNRSALQVNLS